MGEIHLSNVGAINDFYQFLGEELTGGDGWFRENIYSYDLSYENQAGTFTINYWQAKRLYQTLEVWDLKDTPSGEKDNRIGEATFTEIWKEQNQSEIRSKGFMLPYTEFSPSSLWQDNRHALAQVQREGRLGLDLFKEESAQPYDVDEAATLATIAGYTPDVILLGGAMASSASHTQVIFDIHNEGRMWAVSHFQGADFHIHVNLSTDMNRQLDHPPSFVTRGIRISGRLTG